MQIHLERESYIDIDETYDGLQDADKSPRIDIKYSVWNSNIEIEYYMEAKNLAENNWIKNQLVLLLMHINSGKDILKQVLPILPVADTQADVFLDM